MASKTRLRTCLCLVLGLGWGRTSAQDCDGLNVPADLLRVGDREYVEDFQAAFRQHRELSLDSFLAENRSGRRFLPVDRESAPNEPEFLRGDSNGDGRLDTSDVICTLTGLFGGDSACAEGACPDAQDADDSGEVNISDPIRVLAFLFAGGAPLPEPFSTPGLDPTEDDLSCAEESGLGYEPMLSDGLDLILPKYPLHPEQEDVFRRNGFVILDNVRYDSFFYSFFELYRQDLPIYISADAVLDALHLSFDRMLITLEESILIYELGSMLSRMDCEVAGLVEHAGGADITAEVDDAATWTRVALSLLTDEPPPCDHDRGALVGELVDLVLEERPAEVDLFGCRVIEDFSQFRPRGHYTKSPELERYFRAMMWVQRIGMRFVESPKAAEIAFLLTRLIQDTPAREHWERIDRIYRLLVGASDSLGPAGMDGLLADAGVGSVADFRDPAVYESFKGTAISTGAGQQRINSQILMANPYAVDFTPIPPMYHVLGQRFTVDSYVFTNVVWDRVRTTPVRTLPDPLDLMFVLGNTALLPLIEDELRLYGYHPHLAARRDLVADYPRSFWDSSLNHLWTDALTELDSDTTGRRYPAVLRTEAWGQRMLHTQLASTAQRRRDTILVTKPSYGYGACEYPDAWVDPYPGFYRRLAEFGQAAGEVFADLDLSYRRDHEFPTRTTEQGGDFLEYFENLARSSSRLAEIAEAELAGESLSDDQLAFVNGLVTTSENCTAANFNGWFVHLIYRVKNGEGEPFEPVIADIHTSPGDPRFPETSEVLHVATGHPNAMLLSVKTDCGQQAYIGPVFSYYELVTRDFERLADEDWKQWLETREPPARPGWVYEFVR